MRLICLLLMCLMAACGTDPGCPTPTAWYLDLDGDGLGDPDSLWERCERPEGYVGVAGDCCDVDPGIPSVSFHDTPSICGNGWDWDCSGSVEKRYLQQDCDQVTEADCLAGSGLIQAVSCGEPGQFQDCLWNPDPGRCFPFGDLTPVGQVCR